MIYLLYPLFPDKHQCPWRLLQQGRPDSEAVRPQPPQQSNPLHSTLQHPGVLRVELERADSRAEHETRLDPVPAQLSAPLRVREGFDSCGIGRSRVVQCGTRDGFAWSWSIAEGLFQTLHIEV